MRIGIISDTHLPSLIRTPDELGPQLSELLSSVDLILHAGDVTAPSVLSWCEQFAPLYVARGNNDLFEHPSVADRHLLELEGWRIGLVHEVRPESRPMSVLLDEGMGGEQVDILITGDTHVQRLEFREDVLFINPGSPTLPHHKEYRLGTAAVLELDANQAHGQIIALGETKGAPNPGSGARLSVHKHADGTLRGAT
ncbi:MAG: metallophosphatase family protein [Gammaproteobacteria bacterium]|nr:metallophosphatase family protein [Gammaproteobacteria bacterium]